MKQRYDRVEITETAKEDGNGFLNYDLVAVRAGVYPYVDRETGEVTYELKHPDDLLKNETIQQLNNLPITDGHPYKLVSIDNARELVKGWTHEKVKVENGDVVNKATVFDSRLIADIVTGNKKECSLGFLCDVVEEEGIYEGQRYNRRQMNFKFNHLAMVNKGRCGPECSAKLDEKEDFAVQIRTDEVDQYQKNKDKGRDGKMKIKLDGVEYEVPEVVASRITSLEEKNDELNKTVGQLEGKLDGKDDEINKLKQKNEDLEKNQVSETKLDEAIEARLKLVQDASKVLGEDYDFKGKTERAVKVDAIKSYSGDEFTGEGKSDEYINARFDTIMDFMNGEHSSVGDNNLKFKGDGGSDKGINDMKHKRLQMKK